MLSVELPHDPTIPLLEIVQEKLEHMPAKERVRESSLEHYS